MRKKNLFFVITILLIFINCKSNSINKLSKLLEYDHVIKESPNKKYIFIYSSSADMNLNKKSYLL